MKWFHFYIMLGPFSFYILFVFFFLLYRPLFYLLLWIVLPLNREKTQNSHFVLFFFCILFRYMNVCSLNCFPHIIHNFTFLNRFAIVHCFFLLLSLLIWWSYTMLLRGRGVTSRSNISFIWVFLQWQSYAEYLLEMSSCGTQTQSIE